MKLKMFDACFFSTIKLEWGQYALYSQVEEVF